MGNNIRKVSGISPEALIHIVDNGIEFEISYRDFISKVASDVHNRPKIQYFTSNDFTLKDDWVFFSTSLPYFNVKIINDHIVSINMTISSETGLANGARLFIPNFLPVPLATPIVIQSCCSALTVAGSFMDKVCNYFFLDRQIAIDNFSGSTVKAFTISTVFTM